METMDEPRPPLDYAGPPRRKLPPAVYVLIGSAAGAIILGAIGFIAGFVGPILFTPESNHGPLLGIFLTGPLGFLGGGIVGGVIGMVKVGRVRRAHSEQSY